MLSRHRHLVAAALALAIISAAVVAMRPAESSAHTFRVTLGLKDKEPTDWSGQVTVSGGEVAQMAGWRFEAKDVVQGKTGWKASTRNYIAPEHRYPIQPVAGKPKTTAGLQPWPTGVTLTVRGTMLTVTLTLPKGEVKFEATALLLGEPKYSLMEQFASSGCRRKPLCAPPQRRRQPTPFRMTIRPSGCAIRPASITSLG